MSNLKIEEPQQEELSRGLGVSFAIHAFIFSFFTLKAVFFTPQQVDLTQAVRVDIVGLPEKMDLSKPLGPKPTAPESKPAAEKPAPPAPAEPAPKVADVKPAETKPAPKPAPLPKKSAKQEDAVNLKNQQQSALERLKAMAALEQIKDDVAEQRKQAAQKEAAAQAQEASRVAGESRQIKGNMVSPGTSLTGLNKLQHDTYASDLDQHVKQHWALPEWLARRDFKAKAIVYIDSKGNILGRRIVSSSGNQSYDEEVLQTIDRSAPFPAPPEKFVAVVSVDGILIGFPE